MKLLYILRGGIYRCFMELLFFSEMNEGTKQGLQNLFDGPGSIVWILFGIFVVVSGVLQILDGWQHDKDIKAMREPYEKEREEIKRERNKRLSKITSKEMAVSKETDEKWKRWREERKKNKKNFWGFSFIVVTTPLGIQLANGQPLAALAFF